MKKFIKETAVFVAFFIIVVQGFEFLVPYYWGNFGYATKLPYFLENQEQFNMVIMGSSRMYRHADPGLLAELSGQEVQAFNLAYPATYTPESYFLYERLLPDLHDIDYVLIELQSIHDIPAHTSANYYLTPKELSFAWQATWQTANLSPSKKSRRTLFYGLNFSHRILKTDVVRMVDYLVRPTEVLDPAVLGEGFNGYYTFEEQLVSGERSTEELIKRQVDFQADPSGLLKRVAELEALYGVEADTWPAPSQRHLVRIERLIAAAEAEGIYLIFVLPPRLPTKEYEELLPLFAAMPVAHRIDLADPGRYPELYAVENSFDIAHLNGAGSGYFTGYLFDAFVALGEGRGG